ncbi:MAG TPA: GGDEF domain-containing protein [Deltaproteobacteria bacterium]|nr:GGDEF domain-containing protein [Deltaproteobacteria bacterium]HOM28597.1 GGDEF domain-containing protein [Deltaproteobacteria bacterium]
MIVHEASRTEPGRRGADRHGPARPLALYTEGIMILLKGSDTHTALVDLVSLMAQSFPLSAPAVYVVTRGRQARAFSTLDPLDAGQADAMRVLGKAPWSYERVIAAGQAPLAPERVDIELVGGEKARVILSVNAGNHVDIFLEWAKYLTAAIAKILDNEMLQDMAFTDGLTGLLNYRAFMGILNAECERARRYDTTFSLMMLDIDHFKLINDTFGHPAGDRILVALAERLQGRLRKSDLVFRYGGEEFMAILPQTGMYKAAFLAERIRTFVERMRTEDGMSVTVSIGVSQYHRDLSPGDLIRQVDAGLYLAKGKGRNRVEIYAAR